MCLIRFAETEKPRHPRKLKSKNRSLQLMKHQQICLLKALNKKLRRRSANTNRYKWESISRERLLRFFKWKLITQRGWTLSAVNYETILLNCLIADIYFNFPLLSSPRFVVSLSLSALEDGSQVLKALVGNWKRWHEKRTLQRWQKKAKRQEERFYHKLSSTNIDTRKN